MTIGRTEPQYWLLAVSLVLGCRSQPQPPMVDSPARSSDVVAGAPSAVAATETSIHEPTLIAIADTAAISADGESGVSEDFGYYLGKAADSLRVRGIVIRTHLSRQLRLRLGEHTHEWELPAGITCGYVWINASLKPQTAWGVLTDNELLQWTRD